MGLALGPQPSWAGIITAFSALFTAVALVITALGGYVTVRAANRRTTATIAENQKATTSQLQVIHTLVNSTLTAALQGQLDSTRRELVMMLELADAQREAGWPPTEDRMASIGALRRQVADLTSSMSDRAQQTRAADVQIATEAAREARA